MLPVSISFSKPPIMFGGLITLFFIPFDKFPFGRAGGGGAI